VNIPDTVMRTVGFLAYQGNPDVQLAGTFFLALVPAGDGFAGCLITAGHVIREMEQQSMDSRVHVRINGPDGRPGWIKMPFSAWALPEDNRLDIAIARWPVDVPHEGHFFVPLTAIADERWLLEEQVGPGREVFFPGLFVEHPGVERNSPILRLGTIAAMPGEPVDTYLGAMAAYLVEVRSIGGLSGSPVFVRPDPVSLRGDAIVVTPAAPSFRLLGLVHGHFRVDEAKLTIDAVRRPDEINMGIAIVVPAAAILGFAATVTDRWVENGLFRQRES
jgi:hypothetical protein